MLGGEAAAKDVRLILRLPHHVKKGTNNVTVWAFFTYYYRLGVVNDDPCAQLLGDRSAHDHGDETTIAATYRCYLVFADQEAVTRPQETVGQ